VPGSPEARARFMFGPHDEMLSRFIEGLVT
jgi:hypothetical protein